MSQQDTIEKNVRMALGDMHLQLIVANANIEELKGLLADALAAAPQAPEKPKANGKAKEAAPDEPDGRTQPH